MTGRFQGFDHPIHRSVLIEAFLAEPSIVGNTELLEIISNTVENTFAREITEEGERLLLGNIEVGVSVDFLHLAGQHLNVITLVAGFWKVDLAA